MLAVLNKGLVNPPQELQSPAPRISSRKPKLPEEIIQNFLNSNPKTTFSFNFGSAGALAYSPPQDRFLSHQRLFCGVDEIYCIFLGSLNNLCSLNRQYGLSKGTNEAMFIIEAYRTLRDRGPFPADQVIKELDGSFGFLVYDSKAGTVFTALGADESIKLFWGIAADGSLVVSDKLEVVKEGCAKSFAPFPHGCMFYSKRGLVSFEHPTSEMKPMHRIDSEGMMCGANFNVDVQARRGRTSGMTRVGSEANWAL